MSCAVAGLAWEPRPAGRSAAGPVVRAARPAASGLGAAELRVLPLLPTHLRLPQIAAELALPPHTVRTQAKSIYRKLGAPPAATPGPGPAARAPGRLTARVVFA